MTRFALFATLLAAAIPMSAAEPPMDAAAAFSRLKGQVGEWEAKSGMGKSLLRYELIAGGTVLLEHEIINGKETMLTAYHLDGKRLLLTHYCMAGNQPRMEARAYDPATGEIQFRFLDITNLASAKTGHMRNATMRLADEKHFVADWEFSQDGKLQREKFEYVRIK